jgi:hypothetical protein
MESAEPVERSSAEVEFSSISGVMKVVSRF